MQCLFILRIYIFMYYNRCEQNVFVFIFWFVFFFSSFFLGGWGISDHGAPVCSNRFSPGSLLLPVAHRWASYVRCCNWKCRVSFTEFIIHPHANNLSQELDRISIKLFHCQIKSSANSQLCWGKYLRFLSLFHPLFRIFFLVVFFCIFASAKSADLWVRIAGRNISSTLEAISKVSDNEFLQYCETMQGYLPIFYDTLILTIFALSVCLSATERASYDTLYSMEWLIRVYIQNIHTEMSVSQ